MDHDGNRSAEAVLAALGLTAESTDQEIQEAAYRLDRERSRDAEDAIRTLIGAVRSQQGDPEMTLNC